MSKRTMQPLGDGLQTHLSREAMHVNFETLEKFGIFHLRGVAVLLFSRTGDKMVAKRLPWCQTSTVVRHHRVRRLAVVSEVN